jgi:ribonuclease HI
MMRGITAEWVDKESPGRLEQRRRVLSYCPAGQKAIQFQKMLDDELREGIVVEIPEEQAKWINPTFLVPKKRKGEYRKVLDCRELNEEIQDVHFKMEGAETVCQLVKPGDWATSIDVKSAFNHVPVDAELQPYLAFKFGKKTYTYAGMPFGIKHAPRVFTLLMRKTITAVRDRFQVRAVSYMDDVLLLFDDVADAVVKTQEIATFFGRLGWTLAGDKCELDPVQNIDFLGWRWHLEEAMVSSTPPRREELRRTLANWQEYAWDREPRPVRELAALLGGLNFMRLQVPDASLHMKKLDSTKALAVHLHGWEGHCIPNPSLIGELMWWGKTVTKNEPRSIVQIPSQAMLTTDASPTGWGAVLVVGSEAVYGFGRWSPTQELMTSNAKELVAVEMGLRHFAQEIDELEISSILIQSDNSATVADINRCSARGTLVPHLKDLVATTKRMNIQLQAVHIPGLDNDQADRLSRIGSNREYFLKEEEYKRVTTAFQFEPEVDMFASTPYLPGSTAIEHISETLRQNWTGKRLYLHPPPPLILRTVNKAEKEKAEAILIVPAWKGQPWDQTLKGMCKAWMSLGKFEHVMVTTPRFRDEGWRLPPGDVLAVLLGTKTTTATASSQDF